MATFVRRRIEAWRAQDLGDRWERLDSPPQYLREVHEVLNAAQTILTADIECPFDTVTDFTTAKAALSTVWQLTSRALHGNQSSAEALVDTGDMLDLLDRVRMAEHRLTDPHLGRSKTAFETARCALVRLGEANSVSALIDRVLPAVCELGFDRAILSRVDGRFWVTQAMCIPADPQWASEIARVGQHPAQPLALGLYEYEIVSRRMPMVVSEVQRSPHVHRRIADASLARSYVAAPIMPLGQVIGLLHGDCYFQRRHVDQFDRDVLAIFSIGFGYLLQRNVLCDQIQALQANLSRITSEVRFNLDEAVGPDSLRPSSPKKTSREPTALSFQHPVRKSGYSAQPHDHTLTRRELEVLKMIAEGETNARIANRLVISEGTVKSHVKHVLRKLGADNRAEAVSLFFSALGRCTSCQFVDTISLGLRPPATLPLQTGSAPE